MEGSVEAKGGGGPTHLVREPLGEEDPGERDSFSLGKGAAGGSSA